MSRFVRIPLLAVLLAATSVGGAEAACSGGHVAATLAGFPPEALSTPFYWTTESDGQVVFSLRAVGGHECTPNAVTISFTTRDGTAKASELDYATTSGQRVVSTDPAHGGNDVQPVSVPVFADALPEAVLESAAVELTGVQGGYLSAPTSAALHIVDDDGTSARVSFDGAATHEQLETYNLAGVAVFRAGLANGTTTVPYRIEPGPAPAASPGQDYRAESGTLTFAPGDRIEMIPIQLLNDRETEYPEKFTITLSGADGGAIDGASTMTFTIRDNEELSAPESRLHHPRNRKKYRPADYRIREIHVFTEDKGGSGVSGAEFALRKDLASGKCRWWSGKRWKRKPCAEEVWVKMGQYEPDFFYIRLRTLAPSRGAIDTYTAFSRAIDGAGNRENRFEPGRNANTFEIK